MVLVISLLWFPSSLHTLINIFLAVIAVMILWLMTPSWDWYRKSENTCRTWRSKQNRPWEGRVERAWRAFQTFWAGFCWWVLQPSHSVFLVWLKCEQNKLWVKFKIVSDHNQHLFHVVFVINCIQGLQSPFFSYYPPSYKFLSLFARGSLLVKKGRNDPKSL